MPWVSVTIMVCADTGCTASANPVTALSATKSLRLTFGIQSLALGSAVSAMVRSFQVSMAPPLGLVPVGFNRGLAQPSRQCDDRLGLIAQPFVKPASLCVAVPHHQLQLRYATFREPRFGFLHKPRTQAAALLRRMHRHVVHPASMSVVADHSTRNYRSLWRFTPNQQGCGG